MACSNCRTPAGHHRDTTGTRFTLGFEDATLTSSGFATDTLKQTGLNGSLTGSALKATFYASGASEVAKTYALDLRSGAAESHLAGAFLGDRQSAEATAALNNGTAVGLGNGQTIVLGSGSVVGGSGSVYPDGASSYYNSTTGVSFGADGNGCHYSGDWSNC